MNRITPNDSSMRSREILKQAITFMGTHQLSASPLNYTVCYEYLSGSHQDLKQKIDQTVEDKIKITDQLMENWFDNYLMDYKLADLRKSESDLKEIITSLEESTNKTDDNIELFNHALKQGEKDLVNPDSSIDVIVSQLLESTKVTQASMERMKLQLKTSNDEISELRERLEQVSKEVLSDPLTGLTNRRGLAKVIEDELSKAKESGMYPSLLMLDIDHFKNVNDTYGHLLGDRVIKVVGDAIRNQIKGKDTAARYGGEEFCVLLPETELQNAVKVAENIRQAIEKTVIKRSKDQVELCPVTVSVGVTSYHSKETMINLIERADNALYMAKNAGRNRVVFLSRVAQGEMN